MSQRLAKYKSILISNYKNKKYRDKIACFMNSFLNSQRNTHESINYYIKSTHINQHYNKQTIWMWMKIIDEID